MTIYYWDYSDNNATAKWVKKGNIMFFHFAPSMSGTNWLDLEYFDGKKERVILKDYQGFSMDNNDVL